MGNTVLVSGRGTDQLAGLESRLQVLDLASGEVVLRDLTVSPGGQRQGPQVAVTFPEQVEQRFSGFS